ncbi:cyclin-like protein [Cyathus striatus]|nr:cyclin-like protein [Cyathus striatus]
MSSVPVQRTSRTTRTKRDAENATARPSRVSIRKALATRSTTTGVSGNGTTSIPGKPEEIIDKRNAVKRKRDVLVEVTGLVTNNKTRIAGGITKSKMKEPPAPIEKAKVNTTVFTGARSSKPLERIASNVTTRTIVSVRPQQEVTRKPLVKERDTIPDSNLMILDTHQDMHTNNNEDVMQEAAEELERASKRRHTELARLAIEGSLIDQSQLDADKIAAELVNLETEVDTAGLQSWDDLDADDWDDPLMVSEYVTEVCEYWKEIEVVTMPSSDYMKYQNELTWDHRGVLVDWLLQVHAKFGLLPESLFLCVNILDRFLSARPISLSKLQLVGLACFFIATKFEEMYAPAVAELAFLSDNQYGTEDILKAERYILRTIEWDLRAPGPMGWLRRASKADDCEVQARTIAKYLLEIGLVEWRLINVVPSAMAAVALWLARLTLDREDWTPNLEHYSTYAEKDLLSIAKIILEYVLSNPVPHASLYKKYAQKRYFRVYFFHDSRNHPLTCFHLSVQRLRASLGFTALARKRLGRSGS